MIFPNYKIEYLSMLPPLHPKLYEPHESIINRAVNGAYAVTDDKMKRWLSDNHGDRTIENANILRIINSSPNFFKAEPLDILKLWIIKNFPFKVNRIRYIIMSENHLEPHIDPYIDCCGSINLILKEGGSNVTTSIWDDLPQGNSTAKKIQSIAIEKHKWVKVPVFSPHSVENITDKPRIILKVSFDSTIKWEELY